MQLVVETKDSGLHRKSSLCRWHETVNPFQGKHDSATENLRYYSGHSRHDRHYWSLEGHPSCQSHTADYNIDNIDNDDDGDGDGDNDNDNDCAGIELSADLAPSSYVPDQRCWRRRL
jgi:hypothetical protein